MFQGFGGTHLENRQNAKYTGNSFLWDGILVVSHGNHWRAPQAKAQQMTKNSCFFLKILNYRMHRNLPNLMKGF